MISTAKLYGVEDLVRQALEQDKLEDGFGKFLLEDWKATVEQALDLYAAVRRGDPLFQIIVVTE
jgi:hypothetical protein